MWQKKKNQMMHLKKAKLSRQLNQFNHQPQKRLLLIITNKEALYQFKYYIQNVDEVLK